MFELVTTETTRPLLHLSVMWCLLCRETPSSSADLHFLCRGMSEVLVFPPPLTPVRLFSACTPQRLGCRILSSRRAAWQRGGGRWREEGGGLHGMREGTAIPRVFITADPNALLLAFPIPPFPHTADPRIRTHPTSSARRCALCRSRCRRLLGHFWPCIHHLRHS